jgi:hypothetical protein
MQSPASPPALPSKNRRGCLIALFVAGGLVMIVGIGLVVLLVVFFRSNEGKRVATFVGESVKVASEGEKAPGAHELLKAGCSQGLVIDMEKSWALAQAMNPDASASPPNFVAKTMVLCSVSVFRTPPTCEEVKRVYLAAVPRPAARFLVQVSSVGSSHPKCMNMYDPDGNLVRDANTAQTR